MEVNSQHLPAADSGSEFLDMRISQTYGNSL